MRAEIVAVGTEILLGEIVDTNGPWLASRLPELGIDLLHKSVVGDNLDRLVDTFRRGWDRSDLVIVTGGLGPTADDLTREAVAALLGEVPEVDPELESHLRGLFERRGNRMPEQNVKQAWLIPSARPLPNPRGTAPGWWVERDARIIACMPGVPTEMERMWEHEVRPRLAGRSERDVLVLRTLKTVGLGESTVDEMIRHLYDTPGIGVGTYARADGVHVRIGAKAPTEEAARNIILPVELKIEDLLGSAIWGRDDDRFEAHLAEAFAERGRTLSVLDAGTAGYAISILADAPRAPDYLAVAAVVSRQRDTVNHDQLRTGHGAEPSAEAAMELAGLARRDGDSDFGLGITGVLGPEPRGGTAPGTVHIAVSTPSGEGPATTVTMNQGRLAVKRRVTTTAMMLLRRAVLETS
ncbi:MAG: CinA family nicotinamide mononucleotide deamidase-related protein [Dehalococcoidia bacterium]